MPIIPLLLRIALGAGVTIMGTYIYSRITEKQDADARLDRLAKMIENLAESEGNE